MKNIKTNLLNDLNETILIKTEKGNLSESVKPYKLKPMSSLNRMKSFKPKSTINKISINNQ